MKFEHTHQWIMNVIVDSYRIFSIDNNGNADFSFFAFDSLFELVLKRKILCTDNSGNQTEKQNERILIFSLIGLYLGLKSHKDINTNFISKSLPVNSNPILRIIYFCR